MADRGPDSGPRKILFALRRATKGAYELRALVRFPRGYPLLHREYTRPPQQSIPPTARNSSRKGWQYPARLPARANLLVGDECINFLLAEWTDVIIELAGIFHHLTLLCQCLATKWILAKDSLAGEHRDKEKCRSIAEEFSEGFLDAWCFTVAYVIEYDQAGRRQSRREVFKTSFRRLVNIHVQMTE